MRSLAGSSRKPRRFVFWGGQSLSIVCDQGWGFLWALIIVEILQASEGVFGLANALAYAALAVVPLFLTPLFRGHSLFKTMSLLDLLRSMLTLGIAAGVLLRRIDLVWAIAAVVMMSSFAGLFQSAFYAVLPDIAGDQDELTRDNARLSILISTGGVAMPVIAAAMSSVASPSSVLALISVAYFVSFATLQVVAASPAGEEGDSSPRVDRYLSQLARGIRVVFRDRLVATATALSVTFNLIAGMASTIAPLLILKRWSLSPQLFGFFSSAAAVGGILGGFVAGTLVKRLGIVRSLYASTAVAAAVFAVMGLAAAGGPSCFVPLTILEGLVAVATVVFNVANGTLRQLVVPRDLLAQTFATVRLVAALGSAAGAALGGAVAAAGGGWIGLLAGAAIAALAAVLASQIVRSDSRVRNGTLLPAGETPRLGGD